MKNEWPSDHPWHKYKNLQNSEKLTIWLVFYKCWRRSLRRAKLQKNEFAYFKLYLMEIHARFYKKIILSGNFLTAEKLLMNSLLSRANENIRLLLDSMSPYNLIGFVSAIRSQIELNALINKYISDKSYHEKFIVLNQDRTKAKEMETVINIKTLIGKLDLEMIPYSSVYADLSLLLHPNPAMVPMYAQIQKGKSGTGMGHPNINWYFDRTIAESENSKNWFNDYMWSFLTFVQHFILLIDQLKNDFYLNDDEKMQHMGFIHANFLKVHQKEINDAVNNAMNKGEDVGDAVRRVYDEILKGDNRKI